MEDYREISRVMERTIHKYITSEKIKREYGTDIMLTRAEIHTIAAIGDYPKLNVTSLAKLLGITKGAASQMVYKLVDKGMIVKETSTKSDCEVCLGLTENGKKAYEGHREFHRSTHDEFFRVLDGLSDETRKELLHILQQFDKALDKRLK